uniref:Uncharacterized protein n=1 Tax=Anguilla anguilla TaxID=7936 RepID=A0A0E9RHD1_ANGAN
MEDIMLQVCVWGWIALCSRGRIRNEGHWGAGIGNGGHYVAGVSFGADKIMLLKSHWEWMVLKCSCCFRNACT